jgi:hypothetical protein
MDPAADPYGGKIAPVAAASDPPGRRIQRPLASEQRELPAAAWYRLRNARYQWRNEIRQKIRAQQNTTISASVDINWRWKLDPIAAQTGQRDAQSQHPRLIPGAVRPNVADDRLLLRLGLALGLAYLVFLVAWFWGTRDRRHGVERVVRY